MNMALQMKVPQGTDWSTLAPLLSVFGSYLMSFIDIGIYENNHHHSRSDADPRGGKIAWALVWLARCSASLTAQYRREENADQYDAGDN